MKRVPQYRHSGRPGKLSGMRERAVWYITKHGGQATGAELAAMLGITLIEFNRVARTLTRGGGLVANIVASPTWITETGIVDRHFTMSTPARYIVQTSLTAKTRLCTRRAIFHAAEGRRQEHIEKAARRSRLIAAGLYINEFEAVL